MGRPRKGSVVPLEELQTEYEKAYGEWKKWSPYSLHLTRRDLAYKGALNASGGSLSKEVNIAFAAFDTAIFRLVERTKVAIGDPRTIERIAQAQRMGDKRFFRDLASALKSNVGFDQRMSERTDVAILDRCAAEYLNGNKNFIEQEYKHWENFDIEEARRRFPHDQKMVDHWEATKESIALTLDKGGGLENFRARVIRMAEQLRRRSINVGSTDHIKPPK